VGKRGGTLVRGYAFGGEKKQKKDRSKGGEIKEDESETFLKPSPRGSGGRGGQS